MLEKLIHPSQISWLLPLALRLVSDLIAGLKRQAAQAGMDPEEWCEAQWRSFLLFVKHLRPHQQRTLLDGYINVFPRNVRQYHYRISMGGVELFLGDYRVASFCVHCTEDVPFFDELLAAKLAIECNEQEFLRRANMRPPVGGGLGEARALPAIAVPYGQQQGWMQNAVGPNPYVVPGL
ncbi:MAG: hypothetical protein KGJ86_18855 [Chloroflexota bacterium]|nr:hypothetical protein [Chloroflexota bacterium]